MDSGGHSCLHGCATDFGLHPVLPIVYPWGVCIGQLYSISTDPHETDDLWDSNPEILERLRRELDSIKQRIPGEELPKTWRK